VFVSPERAAARSLAEGSVAAADERAGVRFTELFALQRLLSRGEGIRAAETDRRGAS
jgi:hypothetical protein